MNQPWKKTFCEFDKVYSHFLKESLKNGSNFHILASSLTDGQRLLISDYKNNKDYEVWFYFGSYNRENGSLKLIEIMEGKNNKTVGWMTAEEVIRHIDKGDNHETRRIDDRL